MVMLGIVASDAPSMEELICDYLALVCFYGNNNVVNSIAMHEADLGLWQISLNWQYAICQKFRPRTLNL